MNTKALREYRATLMLSKSQREILIGSLLGDAHLEKQSTKIARLKIEHAIAQKDYVMWKYSQWKDWVLTPPQIKQKSNRNGSISTNIWFNTISHEELNRFWEMFYDGKRKIVPANLILTPLVLAVWFMDDGSRKSRECRGLYLNTQSYWSVEVDMLRQFLLRDFGLYTTLRQQSDGLQIYIPASETPKFTRIVSPFVVASMAYKLPG
jgi:hypothetical protein